MVLSGLTKTIASTATLKLASFHGQLLFCTPLEERFERITRLAGRALNVPVAAVTVINDGQQWFKSVAGWRISRLPLERSLCRFTLESKRLTVFADTRADARTASHPLVAGTTPALFYAGYPLLDEDGNPAGTFCVLDVKPRTLDAAERQAVLDLGAMAQGEFLASHFCDAHRALAAKLGVARREAMIDPLTKVWNRRGASLLLETALEEVESQRTPLVVAMLDLDNFKLINDRYGHQIGDQVLSKVARRLIGSVRAQDPVCRMGGDEFVVIMSHTDADVAQDIVARLCHDLADQPIATRVGAVPVTASLGYAVRQPGQKLSTEELLGRADEALRSSKFDGRNCTRAAS